MGKTLTFLLGILFLLPLSAQERYLDYVFDDSDITVDQNIVYGSNFTALTAVPSSEDDTILRTTRQPLILDLYYPENDTLANRPLVIYLHTGNFLPVGVSGVNGSIRDSSVVFACRRLARLGYVVASADYRLGWLPTHPLQTVRNFTLINAAYRGVQDARTCIRFFRKSVAEEGNPYNIDDNKIVLWGQGTGGYISTNTACLDDLNKVVNTLMPTNKFIATAEDGTPIPMIIEAVNGDLEGKSVGLVPQGYAWPPVPGDTLCVPNHVDYSSDFNMFVNMGGALGDIAWIDENTKPGVFFHVPSDQNAPYDSRTLFVPTASGALPVVEVQGSYIAAELVNGNGVNDVFMNLEGEYIEAAKSASAAANNLFDQSGGATQNGHDYLPGLFPLNTSVNVIPEGSTFAGTYVDASPWDFWDVDFWDAVPNPNFGGASYHTLASLSNPTMSKEKSLAYIDSCVFYFAPHAAAVLDLATASNNSISAERVGLTMAPNPAFSQVNIRTDIAYPIQSLEVFNIAGTRVLTQSNEFGSSAEFDASGFTPGLYIVRVNTELGSVHQKLTVH